MSGEHGELAVRTVVDVHEIEEELARVRWKLRPDGQMDEAAEHAAAEARASVVNLVTVVQTEAQLQHASGVLGELSVDHPSRTLILLAQEERSAVKLEASVSAQTRSETGHRVTTEQVLLHAHGRVAQHLASLVTPLLIPDLPVMLWWPSRPDFESRLFIELCQLSDRLVVDTDDGFEPDDFVKLLQVARRPHGRAEIGDFNWARLMPWRHLAAGFFDTPERLARLAQVQGATISYGNDGSTAQARLLGGWLHSRLATVGIDLPTDLRQDPSIEHGVSQLMIYTGGEEGRARFSVVRASGGRLSVEIRLGDTELAGQTVRVAPRAAHDLLAFELSLPGHDLLYEEALAAAVSWETAVAG